MPRCGAHLANVQEGSREGFVFKKQVMLSLRIIVERFLPQTEMLRLVTRSYTKQILKSFLRLGKLSRNK